jgi:hypothetical protein
LNLIPTETAERRGPSSVLTGSARHAPRTLLLGLTVCWLLACGPTYGPPPAGPPPRIPQAPFDSRGEANQGGSETSIDADGPLQVHLKSFDRTTILCAQTPCVVRLGPGAFDLNLKNPTTRRWCGVSVQFPRKPSVLLLRMPPEDVIADCGATLLTPENGVIYQGALR